MINYICILILSCTTFLISYRLSTFRSSAVFSNSDIALTSDSPKWRYMKKELMAALKQHGDGLKNIEAKTLFYGEQMLKTIGKYYDNPFEPGQLIYITVAHILLILIFGERSDKDAIALIKNMDNIEEVLRPEGVYLLLDIVPFLRYFVPPVKMAYKTLINVVNNKNTLYENFIAARRQLYDHPNVEVFIDHFFKLNITNKSEDKAKNVDETDIHSLGVQMFTAGVTTTAKTMTMMLAILVNHPEIQDAVYEEINDVIGKRQPRMEDKHSMPITQAVILETLRYHSVVPFAIPHLAKNDSELQGYLIPAGTMIFPNIWALHHDPRYWKTPWEFNPNRWIDDGKILPPDHIKKQRLLPFGAGRRQCPGEVFARNRLFLLTTILLQKFKFVEAHGHPKPNYDPSQFKVNMALQQDPYKLTAKPRC